MLRQSQEQVQDQIVPSIINEELIIEEVKGTFLKNKWSPGPDKAGFSFRKIWWGGDKIPLPLGQVGGGGKYTPIFGGGGKRNFTNLMGKNT